MIVDTRVIKKALDFYGKELQSVVCIEELSELQKEICKALRGKQNTDNITEEIADVYICLETLKTAYGVNEIVVGEAIEYKLARLENRIEKDAGGEK